jgi:hypothetical protein
MAKASPRPGELLDLGVKGGIIEKSGSWYSYECQRIGQGRENARRFLLDNPDIAAGIEAKVRKNAGLIADEMLVGPDGDLRMTATRMRPADRASRQAARRLPQKSLRAAGAWRSRAPVRICALRSAKGLARAPRTSRFGRFYTEDP